MWQGYRPPQQQQPPLRPSHQGPPQSALHSSQMLYFPPQPEATSTSDISHAAEQWAKMQAAQESQQQYNYGASQQLQQWQQPRFDSVGQEQYGQQLRGQDAAFGQSRNQPQNTENFGMSQGAPQLQQPIPNLQQQQMWPQPEQNFQRPPQIHSGFPPQYVYPPQGGLPQFPSGMQGPPRPRLPPHYPPTYTNFDPNLVRPNRPPYSQVDQFGRPLWIPRGPPPPAFCSHTNFSSGDPYAADVDISAIDYSTSMETEESAPAMYDEAGNQYAGTAYANFDFESVAQSHSAEAIKKLPSWIREGLEKLEREKQKEREKQRFMLEYEARIKDDPDKPKWSKSPESSSSSRSPSPDLPWTASERQETLVRGTKDMVTNILMAATARVLEKACLEEIEARKTLNSQIASRPVQKSAALAAIAQFGDSDSNSEDGDASGLPPPPAGVLKSRPTAQKSVEIDAELKEEKVKPPLRASLTRSQDSETLTKETKETLRTEKSRKRQSKSRSRSHTSSDASRRNSNSRSDLKKLTGSSKRSRSHSSDRRRISASRKKLVSVSPKRQGSQSARRDRNRSPLRKDKRKDQVEIRRNRATSSSSSTSDSRSHRNGKRIEEKNASAVPRKISPKRSKMNRSRSRSLERKGTKSSKRDLNTIQNKNSTRSDEPKSKPLPSRKSSENGSSGTKKSRTVRSPSPEKSERKSKVSSFRPLQGGVDEKQKRPMLLSTVSTESSSSKSNAPRSTRKNQINLSSPEDGEIASPRKVERLLGKEKDCRTESEKGRVDQSKLSGLEGGGVAGQKSGRSRIRYT